MNIPRDMSLADLVFHVFKICGRKEAVVIAPATIPNTVIQSIFIDCVQSIKLFTKITNKLFIYNRI